MKTHITQIYRNVLDKKISREQALELLLELDARAVADVKRGADNGGSSNDTDTALFVPRHKKIVSNSGARPGAAASRYVVLAGGNRDTVSLRKLKPGIEFITLSDAGTDDARSFIQDARDLFTLTKRLLEARPLGTTLVQVLVPSDPEYATRKALLALLKTAHLENPRIAGQLVLATRNASVESLIGKLDESHELSAHAVIRYEGDEPLASELAPLPQQASKMPWKEGGVYLITGGMGKLGRVFAEEIIERTSRSVIVLTGRQDRKVHENRLVYRQTDVCNEREVQDLIADIVKTFGCLNGVIHCAGVVDDAFILKKSVDDFERVLRPKVTGLMHLDSATQRLPLDFFICFSSIAGVTGNVGQADYATANAFMDAFAEARNHQVRQKLRSGHTLSINWPLWSDGGMKIDASLEQLLVEGTGKRPITTPEAVAAFYKCVSSSESQLVVAANAAHGASAVHSESTVAPPEAEALLARLHARLASIIAKVVSLPAGEIEPDVMFENYGINSIIIARLNKLLEDFPGGLPKTLFFEHKTLRDLCAHLCAAYECESIEWTSTKSAAGQTLLSSGDPGGRSSGHQGPSRMSAGFSAPRERQRAGGIQPSHAPIAIIGVAGRYPKARNIAEYWRNLVAGTDCITEIPAGRWSLDGFYTPGVESAKEEGKSYSKWGGFLDGFSEFDPLFFNISPKEASSMDPQERLFLQICWEVIEDAGYTRASLAELYQKKVGVFAGVTKTGFELYGPGKLSSGHTVHPHTSFSSIANRVSYALDLQGPSFPVDTMCSSSLTAIHEACQHLRQKSCAMAIAGGVNLYLHPSSYVGLCAQNMLAADGRCKSFGSGGDGFVPGEGVGAVLLKPLERAIEDNDHIYVVIRGSCLNHGGRTNGYTVPNPQAQAELIKECMEATGVSPSMVTYIEAHGTGTELGDPIEIRGLAEAFKALANGGPVDCAIGSVKSNIGHLEAAAGIAGLTKVILQLRHKTIVPSLHAAQLNPNIDFTNTGLFVNQAVEEWHAPVIDGITYPRLAGISSFGAGGANAHLIVEEFHPEPKQERVLSDGEGTQAGPALIVLSARDDARLRDYVDRLLSYISDADCEASTLRSLAYTLQVGREPMEERIGVLAESAGQLREALQACLKGEKHPDLFRGNVRKHRDFIASLLVDEDIERTLSVWIEKRKYGRLLDLWTRGLQIDWKALYQGHPPGRISAPTYPFARERYWVTDWRRESPPTARRALVEMSTPQLQIPAMPEASDGIVRWNDRGNGILEVVIDDAATQNEVTPPLLQALKGVLSTIKGRKDLKAVLLSGRDDCFLRGGAGHLATYWSSDVPALILECDVPVIAVMRGDSTGLGWLLSCMCDLMICNRAATYGYLRADPPWRCSQQELEILRRRFGQRYAKEASLGALQLTGAQLVEHGLGMPALDADEIGPYALDLSARLSRIPRESLSLLKRHLTQALTASAGDHSAASIPAGTADDAGEDLPDEDPWAGYVRLDECTVATWQVPEPKAVTVFSGVVKLERHANGVAVVRLLDESNKNTFSAELIQGVMSAFRAIAADDSCKVAVMTGYGSYFACGGTKGGLLAIQEGIARYSDSPLYECPLLCEIPVIAAMQGHGIGAGWTLGMFCDICLYSSESVYSSRFMELGFTPGFGSTLIFPYKLGIDFAREALFCGREYKGKEIAERCSRVVCTSRASLWPQAMAIAFEMARSRKEDLVELKRRSTDYLRRNLESVVQRELAMHDESFIGNEESRCTILANFQEASQGPQTKMSEAGPRSREAADAGERRGQRLDTIRQLLRSTLAHELHMDVGAVDDDARFIDMGLDSVTGVLWIRKINRALGTDITVTKVYSHPSINDLSGHLREVVPDVELPADAKESSATREVTESTAATDTSLEAVAVIGVAGQFPDAEDLDEFWSNLVAGKDSISLVPEDRWSIAEYYDRDRTAAGKTNCRWMGVLQTAAQFDPLFFNIAPRDAELMDPQQRVFLQNCWRCIEDAGYRPSALSGSRCGVFAGCSTNDYAQLAGRSGLNAQGLVGGAISILVARVSYFMNLQGPCLSIDTACSSSLVAISTACENLLARSCDIALAGGVCVLPGPALHIMASKAGMLSPEGRCFTFDDRANGFVPGEGVGVVLLKRLSDAVKDSDRIKAVIRGWGVNHDGKTNGMTAPNQDAQTRLEEEVYDRYSIDVGDIEVVEAHGTGTALGDPIEVEGLKAAFRGRTTKKSYCALGCVKTNVGHLISAAGVAGFIKLLLSITNGRIPPSLHFERLNEHIRLEDSPFYVNDRCREWVAQKGKRRQGVVSSFGFSGTNAHVVLEEYVDPRPARTGEVENRPVLLTLSAKTGQRLSAYAERLLTFIHGRSDSEVSLVDLAYTFQVGREPMKERLAIIASDLEDLEKKLRQFLTEPVDGPGVHRGHIEGSNETRVLAREERSFLDDFVSGKDRTRLARAWVRGLDPDWTRLYKERPHIISAPLYPFATERYWAASQDTNRPARADTSTECFARVAASAATHPLVKPDAAAGAGLRFVASFQGDEFFFEDHKVRGSRVLPGVMYLEMALACAKMSRGGANPQAGMYQLRNVVWLSPITIAAVPTEVRIFLDARRSSPRGEELEFRICAQGAEGSKENCRGTVTYVSEPSRAPMSLTSLRERHWPQRLDPDECYGAYARMRIDHGPSHRGIESICTDGSEVLARIRLPHNVATSKDEFLLHPSILDSAFQASLGLVLANRDVRAGGAHDARPRPADLVPSVPFSLDQLNVWSSPGDAVWAWIRYSGQKADTGMRKADIDIYNDSGELSAQIVGLASRPLKGSVAREEGVECLMFEPGWTEFAPAAPSRERRAPEKVVFFCGFGEAVKQMPALTSAGAIFLTSTKATIAERFQDIAAELFVRIRELLRAGDQRKAALQVIVPGVGVDAMLDGLQGLLRSACLEFPGTVGQVIAVVDPNVSEQAWQEVVAKELPSQSGLIKVDGARWYLRTFTETVPPTEDPAVPWKTSGAYLITGGAGGLGLLFARQIVDHGAVVVLTGRSTLDEHQQSILRELSAAGGKVDYVRADVCSRDDAARVVEHIRTRYGALNGVIHGAGVTRDGLIPGKSVGDFLSVLAPKVQGTFVLDEVTKNEKLDFFCTFSSGGAVLGSVGQCDYACANAFMDSFARYRDALVRKGLRHGRTVSINWPLWKEGGMVVEGAVRKLLETRAGMVPMATQSGIRSFYQALSLTPAQALVMEGIGRDVRRTIGGRADESGAETLAPAPTQTVVQAEDLRQRTRRAQSSLTDIISGFLKIDPAVLDPHDELSEYGFDSISLTELTMRLNESYHIELSPTIFFEHTSIGALGGYLASEHPMLFAGAQPDPPPWRELAELNASQKARERPPSGEDTPAGAQRIRPVAIVGMSGRFPKARDLDEFWRNLCDAKDCISETPADRWDWRQVQGTASDESLDTNVKWGGFMDGIADFDPQFFGISPREAVLMDPQQRLLMTHIWMAMEDAGYSAASLSGTKTGIFAGTAASSYGSLVARSDADIKAYSATGTVASVGPNRMSYFLNLHGPSEAIETACSSSLVAIHRAVSSMLTGECDQAFAGGVNTIITPDGNISFSRGGMLSADGRCKTFSSNADGYVRGEGVGVLFLKHLDQAIEDHDHIYAVIRSSAENHGGRAQSLTAPNPRAQADLLYTAYTKAGIDPATIGYIEAHGTGTALGDPIEIEGIKAAFRRLADGTPGGSPASARCGLGSVKSNIGHLELAAGVAGVIKVVLQLANRKLVKSLHCDELNPHIDLNGTHLFVVKEAEDWTSTKGEHGEEVPRRAGVSSFGFGGANAHVILEEYLPESRMAEIRASEEPRQFVVPLSAKDKGTLKRVARQLLEFVTRAPGEGQRQIELIDLAYTLQLGRDDMDERMACVVSSLQDLASKLERFIADEARDGEIHTGNARENRKFIGSLLEAEDVASLVDGWLERNQYGRVAALWTNGLGFDWKRLYGTARAHRISAPTYPFSYQRYWVGERRVGAEPEQASSNGARSASPMSTKIQLRDVVTAPEPLERAASAAEPPLPCAPAGEECTPALEDVQKILITSLAEALYIAASEIEVDKPFIDLGLDSLTGAEWTNALGKRFGMKVDATSVYDFPDIKQMSTFLHRQLLGSGGKRSAGVAARASAAPEKDRALPEAESADLHRVLTASLADVLLIDVAEIDVHRPFTDLGLDSLAATEWVHRLGRKLGLPLQAKKIYDHPTLHEFSTYVLAELRQHEPRPEQAVERGLVRREDLDRYWGYYFHSSDVRDSFDETGEIVIQYTLSPEKNICLREHVVAGQHLFPTDAYLEMLYLGLKSHFAADSVILKGVSIVRPLAVPQGQRTHVTLVLKTLDEGMLRFSIRSSEQKDRQDEKVHVKGFVHLSGAAYRGALRTPRSGVLESSSDVDVGALYSRLSGELGPFYRSLQSLAYGEKMAVGTVRPTAKNLRFILDPAAINGSLIGTVLNFGSAAHAKVYGPTADVFLPYRLDDVFVTDRVRDGAYRCYGELIALEKDRIDLYFEMVDEDHQPLMVAQLIRLQRVRVHSREGAAAPVERRNTRDCDIAVIGMSCRLPGCRDVEQFWEVLKSGRDCISEVPDDRWRDFDDWYDPARGRQQTSHTKRGGFLDGVDEFDAAFFNISRLEAEIMDPQHRIFLEEVWKAIEGAGYSPFSLGGLRCGVYVGCGSGDFSRVLALKAQDGVAQAFSGNATSILAARISYFLNLKGAALAVDTACSSSLTAIHLACESIRTGGNVLAIAGGISLMLSPYGLILTSQSGMQSASGKCAAFDESADGTVFSEGCGVLFLKALDQAERDGDRIIGVIRGSDYNQDGRTNGITAPSALAQEELLVRIYEKHAIDPAEITLVEAHGTGTPLGDPVEVRALTSAFKRFTDKKQYCALGSVKTNIGHGGFAAGVAGTIKALLCLQNREYVPSLHFTKRNAYIELDESPFYVNTENREWVVPDGTRRLAAVSSFGFSGTNAHVVLEEYTGNRQADSAAPDSTEPVAVVLSAQDEQRLREAAASLAAFLGRPAHKDLEMASIAYTLQVGRHPMRERLSIVARTRQELIEKLGAFVDGRMASEVYAGRVKRNEDGSAFFGSRQDLANEIDGLVASRDYSKLLPLWVTGLDVQWDRMYPGRQPRRAGLPTYPFARERYWPESARGRAQEGSAVSARQVAPVGAMDGCFYVQDWKQEMLPAQGQAHSRQPRVMVLVCSPGSFELEASLVERLEQKFANSTLIHLCLGEETRNLGGNRWLCGWNDVDGYERCLRNAGVVEAAYFLGEMSLERAMPSTDSVVESTRRNEVQLLRLVKFLSRCCPRDAMVDLYLIGCENHRLYGKRSNPHGGGMTGLGYSIAQGDHRFCVRNIDVEMSDLRDAARRRELAQLVVSEPASDRGDVTKFMSGRRYRPVFVPLQPMAMEQKTGLRKGGVYVLVGGSGVVGQIITRYLLQEYAARVVWIGSRRADDAMLAGSLKALQQWPGEVSYIQADVKDLAAMSRAIDETKRRYTKISGAIFAAARFSPNDSFQQTTEQEFLASFDVKARGSCVLYQALQKEDLDFLVYFSSGQAYAFSGAAQLSAYAAGITFADAFLRSLRAERFPVGVVNWGFWNSAIERVSQSRGNVEGLDDETGFRCFEYYSYLLSKRHLKQVLCMKASARVESLMDIEGDERIAVNE